MKPEFTRLRGMQDLLPQALLPWQQLEAAVREVMHAYAYGEVRTPLLERTSLFTRSIGEATDIVEKEMYSFPDRKGESVSLRPENTASCVRAAIENGLLQPGSVNRLWYLGPMFRYERPQLGRQRQFWQTGAEVYGVPGPAIEAELIVLSARLWKRLGIESALQLEVNSLGTPDERAAYRALLVSYFQDRRAELDPDSVRRLERNPLRILDSKSADMQDVIAAAPALRDSLGSESLEHFSSLQSQLAAAGVSAEVNPRLVRGLDYYSHTVFEWTTDKLGAQSAVCAGGRYDGLLAQFGVRDMPGVGWALGIERVIALMAALEVEAPVASPDVFVMSTADVPADAALALAEAVRDALPGLAVLQSTTAGSLKSQFKKADKVGAAMAIILGDEEHVAGTVTVKPLRGQGAQVTVAAAELGEHLKTLPH